LSGDWQEAPPVQGEGSELEDVSASILQGTLATVVRNSAFVFGAQILMRLMGFAFNVFIVRKLGAVHFGQYAAVMAYVAMFGIFTDLGMAPYMVREMAEDRARTASLLPNSIAVRSLLSLLVIGIAPLVALGLGKDETFILGLLLASAGQLLWAFQGPFSSALISRERLDYDAMMEVVERFVFWLLGALLLVLGKGFIGLIIASLAGVGARAIGSAWMLFKRLGVGGLELNPRRWVSLVRGALPFGVSSIAYVIMRRFDTLLMSFILTDRDVGLYNVPITFMGMLLLVATSVGQSVYPSMVRANSLDPAALSAMMHRVVKYLLLLALPITVGGVILADKIILLLYSQEFAGSIPILRVMLWALPSLFLLEIVGKLANTLHLEKGLARVTVINAGITVGLNIVMIPTLGIIGAAIALVAGRAIRLIQTMFLIGGERLSAYRLGELPKVFLAAGIMGLGVYLLRTTPLIMAMSAGGFIYILLLFALRVVNWDEIRRLMALLPAKRGAQA